MIMIETAAMPHSVNNLHLTRLNYIVLFRYITKCSTLFHSKNKTLS